MKLTRLLLGCLFVFFATSFYTASVTAMDFYMVVGDQVNIRKGPGQKWRVVAKAEKSQLVLETRREGVWSEIFFLDSHKRKTQGWVYNKYIQPQTLAPVTNADAKFDINVSAGQPACNEQSMITGGSLCYLDVHFIVHSKTESSGSVQVNCWADFVVPGRKSVTPVQASVTQNYHLMGGQAEDSVRLKAALKELVDSSSLNVAYYNCLVK